MAVSSARVASSGSPGLASTSSTALAFNCRTGWDQWVGQEWPRSARGGARV
jgi:hypothetical protein